MSVRTNEPSESIPITVNPIHICYSEVKSSTKQGNKDIKRITINKKEYEMSLYADDTSLVIIGLSESLNWILIELDYIANILGLRNLI